MNESSLRWYHCIYKLYLKNKFLEKLLMNFTFCHTVFTLSCWVTPLTREYFCANNTCFCTRVCAVCHSQCKFTFATFVVAAQLWFLVVFACYVTVVWQFVCWHTRRGWYVFPDVVNNLCWTTFRGSQWDKEVSNPLWWDIDGWNVIVVCYCSHLHNFNPFFFAVLPDLLIILFFLVIVGAFAILVHLICLCVCSHLSPYLLYDICMY